MGDEMRVFLQPRSRARRAIRSISRMAAIGLTATLLAVPVSAAGTGTYRNPLEPVVPGDGIVESCADPTVIQGQEAEGRWYMYCTTDPLNDEDRLPNGDFQFHLIPMLSSADLVHWTYEGDAFASRPAYATANAGLWAPEIAYYPETGNYHLYYTVTDTTLPGGGSAIGLATGPDAPWPVDAPGVRRCRAARCRLLRAGLSPLGLRPRGRPDRRSRLPLLRLLLRWHLRPGARGDRPDHRSRDPDQRRHRQQVRGRRGRAPRWLLLPVRLARPTAAAAR